MITVMVITDSIKNNEMISSSIIGGFENTACIIAATDISECEQIIRSQKHDIDIFIIQIRMKEKGGRIDVQRALSMKYSNERNDLQELTSEYNVLLLITI